MYSESFRYLDYKFLPDLLGAVTNFCNDIGIENVVSITGNPRSYRNHDMASSDDGRGNNYSGGYVIWYKNE